MKDFAFLFYGLAFGSLSMAAVLARNFVIPLRPYFISVATLVAIGMAMQLFE